jgi:hypothetical protein
MASAHLRQGGARTQAACKNGELTGYGGQNLGLATVEDM